MRKQTKKSIDYAALSWNPLTGCTRGCPYCYARKIVTRFPKPFGGDFQPRFHLHRLTEIVRRRPPTGSVVFVGTMTDIMDPGHAREHVQAVIDVMAGLEDVTFLVLSKMPTHYSGFRWPKNAVLGCTYDVSVSGEGILKAFVGAVKGMHCRRWVSVGPTLGPSNDRAIAYMRDAGVQWVVCEPLKGSGPRRERQVSIMHCQDWAVALKEGGMRVWMKNGHPQERIQ